MASADVRSEIPIANTSLESTSSSPPSMLNGDVRSSHTGISASLKRG